MTGRVRRDLGRSPRSRSSAIVLVVVVGGLIILVSSSLVTGSFDPALPFDAYAALIDGAIGSFDAIVHTLVTAAPLILGGLSVGSASRPACSTSAPRASSSWARSAPSSVGAARRRVGRRSSRSRRDSSPASSLGACWGFIPGVLKATRAPTRSSPRSCSTSSPSRSSRGR